MFELFEKFFSRRKAAIPHPLEGLSQELRVAATVLLLEVIRADLHIAPSERFTVDKTVRDAFDLDEGGVDELIRKAEAALRDGETAERVSPLVNEHLTLTQKRFLLALLWSIALADERIERNEDYIVRKVARLLNLNHLDIMDARMKAEAALWQSDDTPNS
jgi:uncharacterized tellurite resistance protein B-like protein